MEIKFQCANPNCGQHIAVDDTSAGATIPCPVCGFVNTVPVQPKPEGKMAGLRQIEFICSNHSCGTVMVTDELHAGARLKCPSCGRKTKVPKLEAEIPKPTPTTPALPFRRRRAGLLVSGPLNQIAIGIWIMLGVLGVIGGRMVTAKLFPAKPEIPSNLEAMLQEISSVGEFVSAPVANHAGTRLWYARDSEHGAGIYQVDLTTLARKKMFEIGELDFQNWMFQLYGWSPDDRYLIFADRLAKGKWWQALSICDGKDGTVLSKIKVEGGYLQSLTWLSTNSFAYLDEVKAVHWLEQAADGTWKQLKRIPLQPGLTLAKNRRPEQQIRDDIQNQRNVILTMTDYALAFVNEGNIGTLHLPSGEIQQVTHFKNATLEWVNYCKANDDFLFCKTDATGKGPYRYLYRFDRDAPPEQRLTQITSGSENTFNGRWLHDGSGVVYVSNPGNVTSLAVRTTNQTTRVNLFEDGFIRAFSTSPDGNSIYAVASQSNEPQSIWEYSLTRRQLRNVAPALDKPFVASKIITPIRGTAKTKAGGLPYILVPPRDFDRQKKYPLLIDGPTEGRWKEHPQFLANAGIYYLAVNRRGLASSDDLSGAARDIVSVYDYVVQNPNIDPDRIFIVGFSASTGIVTELVEKRPELWQGAIFNNPAALPKFSQGANKYPRILISMGDTERFVLRVEDFRLEAAANCVMVKTVYHSNAGHVFRNTTLARERDRLMAEFILGK